MPAPGFLANDTDPDGDPVTATLITAAPASGALVAFPDGRFTYTPDPGFVGTDRFSYRISDGFGGTDEATVVIRVTNREPSARNDTFNTRANTPLVVPAPGFLANDADPDGDPVTATLITAAPASGSLVAFPDGSFTYTPNPGFVGTDRFSYRISDGFTGTDEARVTILVTNGNPRAHGDTFRARPNTPLVVPAPGFLENDTDPNGDPVVATVITVAPASGTLAAFPDGSFTYTPNPGFVGTDRFSYRITDGFGGSDEGTVVIRLTNRNPRARNDSYTTAPDTALVVAGPGFLANDTDGDGDPIVATLITATPASGSLTAFADGSFSYTPNPGFVGTDRFSYRITDGFAGSDEGKVVIKVRP